MEAMRKLILFLSILFLSSCGTDRPFSRGALQATDSADSQKRSGSPDSGVPASSEATLSRALFEAKVLPMLQAQCTGCHENFAPTYEKAIALVKGGVPLDSRLYLTAIGKASHAGGEIIAVGSAEETLLKDWISGTAAP